ncbi:MAG: hypothetical protein FVQ79_03425 [Planctomycetes bacterium]|nr:hypothetical protein [Planctomycetota bacterium]
MARLPLAGVQARVFSKIFESLLILTHIELRFRVLFSSNSFLCAFWRNSKFSFDSNCALVRITGRIGSSLKNVMHAASNRSGLNPYSFLNSTLFISIILPCLSRLYFIFSSSLSQAALLFVIIIPPLAHHSRNSHPSSLLKV